MDESRIDLKRKRSIAPVYSAYQPIATRSGNVLLAYLQFTGPELLLGLVSLLLYTVARNSLGSTAIPKEVALANAETLLTLEALLMIDYELWVQSIFLQWPTIVWLFNGFYTICHVAIPISVLIYLCSLAALNANHQGHYYYYRSIWILTSWLSLLGLAFFPVMPPRLIAECEDAFGACLGDRYPFVDTQRHFAHMWWGWQDPSHKRIYNHYGSCPSLQAAWALWATLAIWPYVNRKRFRTVWTCYYPMTCLATIVTGNHYVLDELAGVLLFIISLLLGNWIHEYALPKLFLSSWFQPLLHIWTRWTTLLCSFVGIVVVLALFLRIPDMHQSAEVRKHIMFLERAEVHWRESHSIARLARLGGNQTDDSTVPPKLDVVYLWANSTKTCHNLTKEMKQKTARSAALRAAHSVGGGLQYGCAASRWADHSELLYSLRALDKYASHLINKVYIVTQDGQLPRWVRSKNPDLIAIHQDSLLQEYPEAIPALDSQAIEWNLDRIPGLTERFLYLNDDIFINKPLTYKDFWIGNYTVARFDSVSTATYAWMHMFHPWFGIMHTGQELLDRKFGWVGSLTLRPTAAHVVWAFQKEHIRRLREMYGPSVKWTITSHIRDERDVQLQFMYYHTLIEEDLAVHAPVDEGNELIHSFTPEAILSGHYEGSMEKLSHYQGTMDKIEAGELSPKFFCLQDPSESGGLQGEVVEYMVQWLAKRFPEPSRWERRRRPRLSRGQDQHPTLDLLQKQHSVGQLYSQDKT
eukprot:gb/GEZN01002897.1/.p1 GENE.gb/GEZN01002897.1/~~gb/GEZN01002897.1/.p1  ORF type:complete len:752 (-),score=88.09 gb/GEZN01002897.1/:5-2260(-)